MNKNVLVSLTLDEAKRMIEVLETYLASLDVSSDHFRATVKTLYKFYEALEYVENS